MRDSTGAVLEFFGNTINEKDVKRMVMFEGDDTFHVAPWKITDYLVMSLWMMRGMLACKKEDKSMI